MKYLILILLASTLVAQVDFLNTRVGDVPTQELIQTPTQTDYATVYSKPDTLLGKTGTCEVWVLKKDSTVCAIAFLPDAPMTKKETKKVIRYVNRTYDVKLKPLMDYYPSRCSDEEYLLTFIVITGDEVNSRSLPGAVFIVNSITYKGDVYKLPVRIQ